MVANSSHSDVLFSVKKKKWFSFKTKEQRRAESHLRHSTNLNNSNSQSQVVDYKESKAPFV